MRQKLREIWQRTTTAIEKAQVKQQKAANNRRRAAEYAVGEKLWLLTAHFHLRGDKELDRSMKFSAEFIGPFTIIGVKERNAYKLELPPKFQMHDVVNISRLKRFVDGTDQFPSREVEEWRPSGEVVRDANGELEWEVERIIARRGGSEKPTILSEVERVHVV